MHTRAHMYFEFIIPITIIPITINIIIIITLSILIIIVIVIIIIIIMIISIVIIDVFGTCCQGSWPMMPASGSDQLWRPVLLACGVNSAGQWWWPVVLPSVAVQFAGLRGNSIARRVHQ